jgi:2-isopropylmalate synthase
MGVEEKLEMFRLLVKLGLKQIEVAFPSASEIEFSFVRTLIERNLIPDDVTIQVLTQARENLIRRTFEAIRGSKSAIVHLYNSTSTLQRRVVFGMDEQGITDLAIKGTKLIRELANGMPETDVRMEYSPESFTGTELPFSLRICSEVAAIWGATKEKPLIINLPSTVEMGTPNVYADQIEWMNRNLPNREAITLSVHTHNDRGTAVASSELAIMAGADRVEGTLFGYGERTGNVDLVTLALNMLSQGIDPELDLSNLPEVIETVYRLTDNPIHPRHPYAGELVFTAFSGSHQDAINKGMQALSGDFWEVPYLTIDPRDVGRTFEAIIRVNSQSGKGGVAWILRLEHGLELPKAMQPEFAQVVQKIAEQTQTEVKSDAIWGAFKTEYLEQNGRFELVDAEYTQSEPGAIDLRVHLLVDGKEQTLSAEGNGPIEALAKILHEAGAPPFELVSFREHSLGTGADARAAAYVALRSSEKERFGCGLDANTTLASLRAVVSAANRLAR